MATTALGHRNTDEINVIDYSLSSSYLSSFQFVSVRYYFLKMLEIERNLASICDNHILYITYRPRTRKGALIDKQSNLNNACSCKRSRCAKNYCQCFDRKTVCGEYCRCFSNWFFVLFQVD